MTTETTTGEIRHTIGLDGLVHLGIRDGRLRVRGVPGGDATIRSLGRALDRLQVERGDRSLSVRVGSSGSRDLRPRASDAPLDVEVPIGATLVVEAASADIEVEDLSGEQRVRTASGDISVRGPSGDIAIEAMSGDVRIEIAGSASFDLRTVSGDLAARAGSIQRLRAFTTSGDLTVAGHFSGTGPFDIVTVSGDIEIEPTEPALRVEVRTVTGDLSTDLPHRLERAAGRRSLVIGGGGPLVDVRSTSGDIAVARPRPTAPTPSAAPVEPAQAIDPAQAAEPAEPATERHETAGRAPGPAAPDPRLEILRALERGDIDLETAREQLEAIDRAEEVDHAG